MANRIFINYRRLDAQADAGRLFTTLQHELADTKTFLDTSTIAPGAEWPEEIRGAVTSAGSVVVLIGPDWLRAGADAFGQRPIDSSSDWVRREIETALEQEKHIVPVLLRQATMPPPEVLPPSVRSLTTRQALEVRSAYWDHDVKLLIQQLQSVGGLKDLDSGRFDPYPVPPDIEFAIAVTDEHLSAAVAGPLEGWQVCSSPLPEDRNHVRIELFREYKFAAFQDAIAFMSMVAPGCDIANHHPRWENIWRTLRVYLTTWNIGHRISDRDIQLAKYFDASYAGFAGRLR
jgi:pterin-4a-carbinolamine dehydratase